MLGVAALVLFWAGAAQAATVTLAWNPSAGATGYRVYWGTLPGTYSGSVDVGAHTAQQVTGLVDGTPYYFVVRAYNASGV